MKRALHMMVALAVAGCQTPSGVRDTAALTTKMTTQLNSNVADYVAASNAARQSDARRLASIQENAARRGALNSEQFRVLEHVSDERGRALLASLRGPVLEPADARATTSASAIVRLQKSFSANTYDTAPLTSVATSVGPVAKPLNTNEQLQAFASFAKQVYSELKQASVSEDQTAKAGSASTGSK